MKQSCWKCAREMAEMPTKLGFRATCPHCGIDLHCCRNCRYYTPGKPNDCAVPGTDWVRDREAANLCEEFRLKESAQNSSREQGKGKFDSLFKKDS